VRQRGRICVIALASFRAGMASLCAPAHAATETATLAALKSPVEVLMDRWGVPHVYAQNEDDLFFAQGFVIARDRLFQLDLWRRRGLGQLAEVFGPAFVEQDQAARLFLYRGDLGREWAAYGADTARIFERFVAGINAYVDWLQQHPDRLPFEFRYLHYQPAHWKLDDTIRIRSHGYLYNLLSEVERAKVACSAGLEVDALRVPLEPAWQTQVPAGLDPCLPADVLRVYELATRPVRFGADKDKVASVADPAPGRDTAAPMRLESNNWVIGAMKSTTGRAIAASDPHLAFVEPSVRYVIDLNAPTLHAIGATRPEYPGISLGHNDWIAFVYTSFPTDEEDLYVYDLNPADPDQYRYQGRWERVRTVREEIAVKGHAPVAVELKFTRHGPLIYLQQDRHRAFAVRSTWFEPGTAAYFPSSGRMRSRNFDEFVRAVEHWGTPSLNHLYADVHGNIGWTPRGKVPVRPGWDGLLPVPADGRYEWAGFLRGREFPQRYNPTAGYLTTSNEMNLPADYPYRQRKLGFEWSDPYRHLRIEQVLSQSEKVSVEDCMRLQGDVVSIPAQRLIGLLQRLASDEPDTTSALQLLQSWPGTIDAESAPAALFEVWFSRYLGRALLRVLLNHAATEANGSQAPFERLDPSVLLDVLEHPEPRLGANARAQRDALLLETLRDAYRDTVRLLGPDSSQWAWGRLHHSYLEHPLSAIVDEATRAKLDIGPLAKAGSEFTVNRSSYRTGDFRETLGPSVRVVLDVGHWDDSRAINYPGQSGDPESPHYRDLASTWQHGEYFPLLYSRGAVEAAVVDRLLLKPMAGGR